VAVLDSTGWVSVQETPTKVVVVPVRGGRPVQKNVAYIVATHYPPGDVKVYDSRGRTVDPKDLPKLLKNPVPVLVSTDGKKVDPYYLKKVKKGTLVLVPPKAQDKPYQLEEGPSVLPARGLPW